MERSGIIFNIQRFTINDGTGIRTEVFLKGCPFHCDWCSNPESQNPNMEPGIYPGKCISDSKCGLCIRKCRNQALLFAESGKLAGIDRGRCAGCMECAKACPADAIKSWGIRMTLEEVMQLVERDRHFYEKSGGGVTLSGGEPLVQYDFTKAILKSCREAGIHTCLESTFYTEWELIEDIISYADQLITDIKMMDPEKHRRYIGAGNERILANIKRIAEAGHKIILRIPVIPGINDDMDNISATADFIERSIGEQLSTLQLLSFMRMGEEKIRSLERPYKMDGLEFDRTEFQGRVNEIANYFNSRNIHCLVGTREK